jgi:hypothetical protein
MDKLEICGNYGKAALMLSADWPEKYVDVLFLHAVSRDATGDGRSPESDFFLFAARLFKTGRIGAIVINGSEGERYGRNIPGENWEGATGWTRKLIAAGVPVSAIIRSKGGFNTREENAYFLETAKERGWRTAGVLTVNYHFPRCFMGYIKVMEQNGYRMKLYAFALRRVDWFAPMTGSQGMTTLNPLGLINSELEPKRLPAYMAKGDLCTFPELFEYVQNRDKARS